MKTGKATFMKPLLTTICCVKEKKIMADINSKNFEQVRQFDDELWTFEAC